MGEGRRTRRKRKRMRVRRMMRERVRVWCQAINIDHANEFTKNIPIIQNFNFNLNFKGRIFQENKSRREKKMKTRKMKKKNGRRIKNQEYHPRKGTLNNILSGSRSETI